MGNADAVLAALQAVLRRQDGGFAHHGSLEDFFGRGEGNQFHFHFGRFEREAFGRLQFDELAQVKQGQFVVVVGLYYGHLVLCHTCLGFGHFGGRGFAQLSQAFDARILLAAQVGLSQSHLVQFLVEEHLQVGRSHVDGNVILGFVQVGNGSFQVQLGQGILVGQLQSRKDRDAGIECKVGPVAAGVYVVGGIVAGTFVLDGGLGTSPAPALAGASVEVGQAGPFGGIDFDGTLAGCIVGLADIDVMLDGVFDAPAQRPRLLGRQVSGRQQAQGTR